MKARFVDNEHARPLVTIREDDLIWRGQDAIDPIPEGAIVRAYIPADAKQEDVERALQTIRARALSVTTYSMPASTTMKREDKSLPGATVVREVVMSMVNDPELLPLIEETLSAVKL